MGKLQVDLLGSSFAIQAKEDSEYLEKLLSYYRDITTTLKRANNLQDSLQVSILAGITLVDELYKTKTQNATYNQALKNGSTAEAEATRLTMEMIQTIDDVL